MIFLLNFYLVDVVMGYCSITTENEPLKAASKHESCLNARCAFFLRT